MCVCVCTNVCDIREHKREKGCGEGEISAHVRAVAGKFVLASLEMNHRIVERQWVALTRSPQKGWRILMCNILDTLCGQAKVRVPSREHKQ